MMRKLLGDESGVAMGLAVIMIVLIAVMGAGLLVFVRNDLEAVVEVNQGQQAFEMADAGVQAAKRQLTEDSGDINDWQPPNGMDIEMDGDSVNVTIEPDAPEEGSYTVISTGKSGDAQRKIEAVFEGAGGDWSLPAYYTHGNIEVKKGAEIKGVSMFSRRSIILRDYDFDDYGPGGGGNGTEVRGKDELGDWDSTQYDPPSTYNTQPRSVDTAGFAAEDFICSNSLSNGACQEQDRIADGVYGYDSTTGDEGTDHEFIAKDPPTLDPNPPGTITYPFARTPPDADALKQLAEDQGNYVNRDEENLDWDELYPNAKPDRVVFVDLGDRNSTFQLDNSSNAKGVLVVRCGDLELQQKFTGIIILLKGEGDNCGERARFTHNSDGRFKGYVYAEGDKDYGIRIKSNSRISQPPGKSYDSIDGAGSGGIELQSWRECYSENCG